MRFDIGFIAKERSQSTSQLTRLQENFDGVSADPFALDVDASTGPRSCERGVIVINAHKHVQTVRFNGAALM